MPLFEWTDAHSVGIAQIDAQHKQLLEVLNRFYETSQTDGKASRLSLIFADFLKLAVEHFATEERLMKDYGYPAYVSHKKEHDACVKEIVSFQETLGRGDMINTIAVCEFLKKWINHHLEGDDKEYVEFFKAKGVK